ncbi:MULTISPECIES: hypothetical protein [unclassified Mesorhizobium]|uniref:hypothetical protein n=1 Tax=unclassified Mesorhizobium TaxID=325217 RepID=UPI0016765F82|nr:MULTISPECIES: hypothetical protein [unclassified Mesorhizobium]
MIAVPLYIAAITASVLAGAVWRYRQRDMVGMSACLLMAGIGAYVLFRELPL